ncbi:MAG: hypothetical protein BGO26_07915 [Actinobacteria bacterium 69-20]|nr:MAG: hypothetical protein BGO26_07915 [Actinobacteria bacterium 69-20]
MLGAHGAAIPGQHPDDGRDRAMAHSDSTAQGRGQRATATIVLRRRTGIGERAAATGSPAVVPEAAPGATEPMTSAMLGERFGAEPADMSRVCDLARAAGLTVVEEHAPSRRVRVEGPAEVVRRWLAEPPSELSDVVVAVLGGTAPQAFPRSLVAVPHAGGTSYTPPQLAEIYRMPAADGSGQTVAIIELGGGFAQADLDTYFGRLGIPTPTVRAIGVDGAANVPGQDPTGADGEVLLDIEVVGALAPAATIDVYFAPNTDAGFLDAIAAASHATPTPTAISISWGQSEDQWTAAARTAMDQAFADAIAMGITVTAAAGDNGSSDTPSSRPTSSDATSGDTESADARSRRHASGRVVHADFPASSPHVLGCGGTSLVATNGAVDSEVVWNDGGRGGATGGGVSDTFPLPAWQQSAGVPARVGGRVGRGVPDVAAVADPQTGYQVYVDGSWTVIGGTSAVAPLWAALVARIVQLTGARVGLAQSGLYGGVQPAKPAPHTRDITKGSNGAYKAGIGWDPCTGLGVPESVTPQAFSGPVGH